MIEIAPELFPIPPEERKPREELLSSFARLVIEKSLPDLLRVKDELEKLPPSAPISALHETEDSKRQALLKAWTRNLIRVFEDQARLMQESLPAHTVSAGLGISEQRLNELILEGSLLAVPVKGGRSTIYPSWQFTAEGHSVRGLEQIILAGRKAEMDPETLHFFMVEPNERLAGDAPVDCLARGEIHQVVQVLRSAGLGPF